MVNSFLFSFSVATALGFLAGLGVGGGSLLMLWLTVIVGTEQPEARIINLLFFIPAAVICCLFRIRDGSLDLKKALPAMAAGCIAAAAGSLLGAHLELSLLKKLFGVLLLVTGVRELLTK